MDRIEIMLIKSLVLEELNRLEMYLFKSNLDPIEYMKYKELHDKYTQILLKLN